MATKEQLERALINADAAGDTAGAVALATALKALETPAPPAEVSPNPATDFGPQTLQFGPLDTGIELPQSVGNFLSGAGKAGYDLARGGGQLLGLVDQAELQDIQKRDQPLMDTGAGTAGNLAGNIVALGSTALIPGANTYAGAAAIGAGSGLLNPVAEGDVFTGKAKEAAIGGLLGSGALAAGRGLVAAGSGLRGLVEPFTRSGQESIVGRTLNRFATNADDAARSAVNAADNIPGYQSTLAEITQDPGLATLQRAVGNTDAAAQLGARDAANVGALKSAIKGIAGDDAALAAAKEARSAAAAPLYEAAGDVLVPADETLQTLLQRPSISKAWDRAQALAAETGDQIVLNADGGAQYSGRGLHYLKMALDDMLDSPQAAGIGKHEAGAIKKTREQLLNWLDSAIPDYGKARSTFSEMSRPVNQMQVGQALYERLAPALDDFAATPGAKAASYAEAVRNAERTVKGATGMARPLEQVMTPEQMQTIGDVGGALARRAGAQSLARPAGTNTAQNLSSQNLMRQLAGPLGVPQSYMEAQVWPTLLRPLNFAFSGQEPALNQALAEALMDPKRAAELMARVQGQGLLGRGVDEGVRYVVTPGLLGANAAQK